MKSPRLRAFMLGLTLAGFGTTVYAAGDAAQETPLEINKGASAQKQVQAKDAKAASEVPLYDARNKKVIGHVDATTLYFEKGKVAIPRKRVSDVSKQRFEELKREYGAGGDTTLKYAKKPLQMQTANPYGRSGGGDGSSSCENCAAGYWRFSEGGASCEGFCEPVSACACFCTETCTDISSSRNPGSR